MPHDQDFAHLQLGDGEFERRRNAVEASARLIGRGETGNVARDKDLARPRVENLRGIGAAVGAGQDHHLRVLTLRELGPALPLMLPALVAKAAITFDQLLHVGHKAG